MVNPDEKGLGFLPGSVDDRDWRLSAFVERLTAPREKGSQWWYNPLTLDQGSEGSCVGHAWTQGANAAPKTHHYDHPFAYSLYKRAQALDEWAGEDYEGTSVRAGGKAAREKGLVSGFAYATGVDEVAMWVLNKGSVVIGIDWMTGMDRPLKENGYYVTPTGRVRGGHALILDGVRHYGDDKDFFRILNSWGASWGYGGHAKILKRDLEALLSEPYAAACTSVEAS